MGSQLPIGRRKSNDPDSILHSGVGAILLKAFPMWFGAKRTLTLS
jgi:hypothetical protein